MRLLSPEPGRFFSFLFIILKCISRVKNLKRIFSDLFTLKVSSRKKNVCNVLNTSQLKQRFFVEVSEEIF